MDSNAARKRFNRYIWGPIGHIFRARTLLQVLFGSFMIASPLAALQWARSHIDILSVGLVFVVSFIVLVLTTREQRKPPGPAFTKLKERFASLRLCEKVALKKLCDAGTMSRRDLIIALSSDGFEDPSNIVGGLLSEKSNRGERRYA